MADRRPRLEDVAAEVGVSTASVSLVLRGVAGPSAETRGKVLEAAARLGYRADRAASLLARRRSRLLGVMLEVRSSFHAELVEDLHEVAEARGYDLVLSTVTRTRDEARAVETLVDSRCEALILLGPDAPASQLTALDAQVPVVVVGRPIPAAAGVDVVRAADDEGTARAVEYLAGLGHRAIVHVDGGPTDIASGRVRGYRDAMTRLGLDARVVPGDQSEEAGTAAARALLEGELPTAVVAFNDRVAVGLLDVLVRAGIDVPGRVSVVGYDDSPLARLAHVDLTTVSQNTHEMTERAVGLAVERLEGARTGHREIVLPPTLVVRGTTAPCAR